MNEMACSSAVGASKMLLLLSSLLLFGQWNVKASPVIQGLFNYGSLEGDTELLHEVGPHVCMPKRSPYRCYYIHKHGSISTSKNPMSARYKPFETTFAIFWNSNVRLEGGTGKIFYRLTTDQSTLDEADRRIHKSFPTEQDFRTEEMLVVTWYRIESGNFPSEENNWMSTFQCVLVFGESDMFIIYIYEVSELLHRNILQNRKNIRVGYVIEDLNLEQFFSPSEFILTNSEYPVQWIHRITGFSYSLSRQNRLLFPYGEDEHNTLRLPLNNDSPHYTVCSDIGYMVYGTNYSCWTVNYNGMMSSNHTFIDFPIRPFEKIKKQEAFLAVFWSDPRICLPPTCESNRLGSVYFRKTINSSLLAEANRRINQAYKFDDFTAQELTIVTWDNVIHYQQSQFRVSKFQCVLAVDGKRMYALYLYSYLLKSPNRIRISPVDFSALVGYTSADQRFKLTVEASLTNNILELSDTSNVGIPGQWIYPLFERLSLVKQDTENPSMYYFSIKPSAEITWDSGRVVIGERENIGVTVTVDGGAVSQETNLTMNLTLKACLAGVVASFPDTDVFVESDKVYEDSSEDSIEETSKVKSPRIVRYEAASSFYAVEKNNVDFRNELTISISHSVVVEDYIDFAKTFVFHLHQQTSAGLKYVATKRGYFSETPDGETYGHFRISNKFFSVLFVRLVRRMEKAILPTSTIFTVTSTPSSTATIGPGNKESIAKPPWSPINYWYSARFYKSLPNSMPIIALFTIAKVNDHSTIAIVQERIRSLYSAKYGINPDDPMSLEQRTVKFAEGSDSVSLEIDKTMLNGYKVTTFVQPLEISAEALEHFDYTNLNDDFPPRINFEFSPLPNEKIQLGGTCVFITSGLKKPLNFTHTISNACLSSPCQNNGNCSIREDGTHKCLCNLYKYNGHNCENEIGIPVQILYCIGDYLSLNLLMTILVVGLSLFCAFRKKWPLSLLKAPLANRVTLQELMRRYKLTDQQLNSEMSNFSYLAIHFDDVKIYSNALSLALAEQADVNRVYHSEGTQAAMIKCLNTWKQHNSSRATYRALLIIVLKLGKEDTAEQICRKLTKYRTLD